MKQSQINKRIIQWFKRQKRLLPWRVDNDPYHVWVSEVMLQQTRVETVIPYYVNWITNFPTLSSLANSNEQKVLRVWEGLGYYSRARNIFRSAGILTVKLHGQFPQNVKDLIKLPGIGRSTAGAIASISFGKNEPILDGNVKRVIARLFNYRKAVNSSGAEKELWKIVRSIMPEKEVGAFNQGLMEIGQILCLPNNPVCKKCPLNIDCFAYMNGTQNIIPVRQKKDSIPHLVVVAAAIQSKGKTLISQRPPKKLMAGMWEFPGGKVEIGERLEQALVREIREELNVTVQVGQNIGVYEHAYTHFSVSVHAFYCQKLSGKLKALDQQAYKWVELEEFENYPMGKVDRLIANEVVHCAQ